MDIIKSTPEIKIQHANVFENSIVKYKYYFLIICLISVAIIQIAIMFEYLLFRRKIYNFILTIKKDNDDKNIQIEKNIHKFIKSQNIELEEKMKIADCSIYELVDSKHIENEEYIKKIEDNLYDLVKSHQINIEEQLTNRLDLNNDKTKLLQQQFSILKENVDNILDTLNENQVCFQQIEELESKCQSIQKIIEEYIVSNKKLAIDIYKFYRVSTSHPPPRGRNSPETLTQIMDCIFYKYFKYDTTCIPNTNLLADFHGILPIVQETYRNEPNIKQMLKKQSEACGY